jgi:hypothetical protein
LSYQAGNVAPTSGRFILGSDKFHSLFNETKRLPLYVKANTKILEESADYVLYRLGAIKGTEKGKILSNISEINKNLLSQVISIQELPAEYFFTKKSGQILHQLFEKYIGKIFIIPYEMERRIELYSDAFKDLQDFM